MSYMDDYVNSLISRHNSIPKPAQPAPRPAPKPVYYNDQDRGSNTSYRAPTPVYHAPHYNDQDRGSDPIRQPVPVHYGDQDRGSDPIRQPVPANYGERDRGANTSYRAPAPKPAPPPITWDTDVSPYSGQAGAIARNNVAHHYDANRGNRASDAQAAQDAAAAKPKPALMSAPVAEPEPVTTTLTIPDPTADATYKEQHAEYAKALDDFTNSQGLAKKQYGTSYGAGLRKLGWNGKGWDQRDTNEGYGQSFVNNEEDFASRGAYNSGLYGKSVADIGDQFAAQKTDLDNANKDFGDNQVLALSQYQHTNSSQDRNALRESMGRIAQKYGVDPNDINQNRPTTIVRDANGKQISAK